MRTRRSGVVSSRPLVRRPTLGVGFRGPPVLVRALSPCASALPTAAEDPMTRGALGCPGSRRGGATTLGRGAGGGAGSYGAARRLGLNEVIVDRGRGFEGLAEVGSWRRMPGWKRFR